MSEHISTQALKDQIEAAITPLAGWCPMNKAWAMADLVLTERPSVCVEVGVFGGRSMLAIALALRTAGHGKIWGFDPYTVTAFSAHLRAEGDKAHLDWAGSFNWEDIYQQASNALIQHGVSFCAELVRIPSREAAGKFADNQVDILHIDGNHSFFSAVEDVVLWFHKVKQRGYIWFDDIDWETTQPALMVLRSVCDEVMQLKAPDIPLTGGGQSALFRKR